ncbi:MAG: coproporphyrinogen III oxidase [Pseudomonadota bacterium]|nr:coproporphyrinogen III oxidase [Pseudomonadota bacterium]
MTPPLAVYIHWPFCKSKCPYCDFNSHVRERVDQARWRAALLKELEYMAQNAPGRMVTSIFFGGGTPSLMPAETAAALIDRVQELWLPDSSIEITLEANPTSVEADTFREFKNAGVNRLSLGVQSLRDEELTFLGRGHSAKEALRAIAQAREHFERYSFDLIYARPGQTPAAWKKELTEALAYAGGHLSLYQLTIEENTAFHHAYAKGGFTLPDEEESEALYRLTEDIMAVHDLPAYEVSNYATPGQESRHNLAYWQGQEYIGIGPGAHGRLDQQNRIATQTIKSPERWLEQVEREGNGVELWQPIPRREAIEERVMMGLRLAEGIRYDTFRQQTGLALEDCIDRRKREQFVAQGLLADDSGNLRATLQGRLVLNRLTAELL